MLKMGVFRVDEFIDVIQGNRVYLKCLYVYNKIGRRLLYVNKRVLAV